MKRTKYKMEDRVHWALEHCEPSDRQLLATAPELLDAIKEYLQSARRSGFLEAGNAHFERFKYLVNKVQAAGD